MTPQWPRRVGAVTREPGRYEGHCSGQVDELAKFRSAVARAGDSSRR